MTRRALLADVDSILNLLQEAGRAYSDYGEPYGRDDWLGLLWSSFAKEPKCSIYVAGGTPRAPLKGVLLVFDMVCFGYVDILYVSPKYRGHRVGASLVAHMKKSAPKRWRCIEFCFSTADTSRKEWAERLGLTIKKPVVWAVKNLSA